MPTGGAFLEIFTLDEIEKLQAPRLRWISKRLPDPRDITIPADHARIYWRIATRDFQSSQMRAELALVLLSGFLGVVLAALIAAATKSNFNLDTEGYLLLAVVGVIVVASAWAVATKTAAGQRWQEAIELYRQIGWAAPEPEAAPSLLHRLFHRARRPV